MAIRDNLGGGSSGAVLDTLEEIASNTESGKAAGALAVKELNESLPQITCVETTTPAAVATDKFVPYPDGYNFENCFVVSAMVKAGEGRWDRTTLSTGKGGLLISPRTNGIALFTVDDTVVLNKTIRIVLQKY